MTDKTVLIADDDPGFLQALALRTQELGLHVRTASDGLQALKLVCEDPTDLLILDINMPAADGLSVCEQLMSEPTYSPLPVIFLSGRSDPETIRRCEALGAHYVFKDADAWPKLEPLIREILQGERAPARPWEAPAAATSPPKILVIDDDLQLAKALKMRLEAHGVDVLTASNGMQGFWMAQKGMPDVIISDYIMPRGNGESVLIRLKSNPLLKFIPVIVVTGRATSGENDRDLKYEMLHHRRAVAFFTKPLDFDALLDELRRHVKLGTVRPRSQEKSGAAQ